MTLVIALAALAAGVVVWFFGATVLDTFTPRGRDYVAILRNALFGLAVLFAGIFTLMTLR